ncbi:extracellular solute-binding protein [Paenibacillus sp. J2TS4]|uniref:extracellular solute-binding protein n=1 Tax=Paenibacillus sp. J2TS4 TaxID=2807194 RepID=UPI001B183960|nr:extracellular solute-binding protein [Paenibacillus sp. J2TS4]GIP31920.1 hypothetical protein J2TS4_11300 [Paenibacillus sp. J2TS4]
MKRKQKQTALALTAAAMLIGSATVSTHGALASNELSTEEESQVWRQEGRAPGFPLTFDGLQVYLPAPAVLDGDTMMVPAQALLEGLGYQLEWDDSERKLSATRPAGPTLYYWADRLEAGMEGQPVYTLPAAPFVEEGMLWIPLRHAAEMSDLDVHWNPEERSVLVSDPNAPLNFSIGTRADNGEARPPEQLVDYMKEEMKVDIRFSLIPPDHYNEKVNLMIAAGDPSDWMLIAHPYNYDDELFRSFASDMTDWLKSFPRLQALAESGASSARVIDGRIYGIPRPSHPHDSAFPVMRQDWLERLGLVAPETMDELYEVLLRFAKQDPDGDGKDNTVGLTGRIAGNGLGSFSWVEQAYSGIPSRFAIDNGEVRDTVIEQGERQALEWLARAYAEGLIDKEFPVRSEEAVLQQLKQNRAGAAALTVEQAAALMADSDPSDVWVPIWVPLPAIQANNAAPVVPWDTEGAGLYIIPRTVSPDKALKILAWFDQGLAMQEAGEWKAISDLEEVDHSALSNVFGYSELLSKPGTELTQLPDAIRDYYVEAVSNWEGYSYQDITIPEARLVLRNKDYIEMNMLLEELKVKVITGKATLDDWDRHIEQMKSSDAYESMMAELNALLP